MSITAEIQQAIISLSKSDYAQLRRWLNEYEWEEWDQQIEADSDDRKLDFLVNQATEAKRHGTLEDLSKDLPNDQQGSCLARASIRRMAEGVRLGWGDGYE